MITEVHQEGRFRDSVLAELRTLQKLTNITHPQRTRVYM